MNRINHLLTAIFFSLLVFGQSCCTAPTVEKDRSTHVLWYDKPATYFEESLVLGNGKMGASVFGGVESDKIYLNDITLWAGEPVDPYMSPEAYKAVPKIREALANEDYELADKLNHQLMGKYSESYAPLGTLFIDFPQSTNIENYQRELDIDKAVSTTSYAVDGVNYKREYFVSYPDQIMVVKLSADKKDALNFAVKFDSQLRFSTSTDGDVFKVEGYAPFTALPNYHSGDQEPIQFDKNRGTRFSTYMKVENDGGTTACSDSSITVSGASEAVLYVSIATSFNGFDKDPAKEGLDNKAIALEKLVEAENKGLSKIKEAHVADYGSLMNRVQLDLGETTAPELTTDERLKRYFSGAEDKNLEVLYFQYGRYLLIASSRTEGVPANLQGLWNPHLQPPWSSNYTMNINVEENYWMAETGNLSEMHRPLLSFIGNVAQTGAITAKTFYGVDKGWAACHNSDIWAMSNPVGGFGEGSPVWACWNMSGPWLSTHLWEHYQFSQDVDFLKTKGYPLMKGAAEFCLNWMVEDKNGNLITSPSTSPENNYVTDKGYRGATLYGATSDLAMIRECFLQTIQASEVLNVDADFRAELEQALAKMYPYQIGKKGNLQEWYYDWEDADPKHRHQSHLFGLHPGGHITPGETPELAEACKTTLEIKGDETTGWSKGWRINLWARLLDGNHAYKMYRELLSYVDPSGTETQYSQGGGTYPNLFDAHPPFQIDGNFGGAAGVIEMLMQSHQNRIDLLPALPDAWPQGSVSGICARGGYEISMDWSDGKLNSVTVLAKTGGSTKLVCQGEEKEVELAKGESVTLEW
ncbi:glycoside hydrolase family 95 protein [Draconibacterium sp. IB214405]|uniref:glycoside hydrolase family 95 protein n=1 Tax=Draconibacterium sp. IB214405 TaxID=3097352 RepID=UPI002A15A272|nr:glycoside hydrolase family 95 protein [Draconibacterium sp. IB214405]MDX8339225.1 glycoside hydrolase family 95 protein [Draconibacterium sp. IB214405]